jgi:hypothetical protein
LKSRSYANNHFLYDSVRGANKAIYIQAEAEITRSGVTSFDSNGFTLGTSGDMNTSSATYVAWVWKGGGDAVNIGVNSITASTPSIASDVSANTEAGFSIVKYTGNNTAGAKVAHGLDYPPEMIIIKNLDNTVAARNWAVYHSGVDANPENYFLRLNSTIDKLDFPIWNDTAPDSDVFTLGNTSQAGEANDNNNEHIAYCFHSVTGYSKIGSYNGDTSTVTVTTGFKPSFVMIKRTNQVRDWILFDTVRSGGTSMDDYLTPNDSLAEIPNSSIVVNATSTGFTIASGLWAGVNENGGEYIYMAFK